MSTVNRIRWGGLAALLAGCLYDLVALALLTISPLSIGRVGNPLLAAANLLALLGMAGLWAHDVRSGRLNATAIALGMTGAGIFGVASGVSAIDANSSYSSITAPTFLLGACVLLLSLMMLGAGTWRGNTLPRWLALALLFIPPTFFIVFAFFNAETLFLSPLLFGVPWMALGLYMLWSSQGRSVSKSG